MRVPLSNIITGSTAGKEYVYKDSGNFYTGSFYQMYGSYYAGKTYNPNIATPDELVPVKKKSINNPNSFLYNVLAGAKQGLNSSPVITKKPTKSQALASIAAANQKGFSPVIGVNVDADNQALSDSAAQQQAASAINKVKRYFFRKIKRTTKEGPEYQFGEIKEDEYNYNIKRMLPPVYVTSVVTETRIEGQDPVLDETELNAAEKKMPGLKAFLGVNT
jgi:hypothetical protein